MLPPLSLLDKNAFFARVFLLFLFPYIISFAIIIWVVSLSYPLLLLQENSNCLLIVTPKGGHLGWVAGAEAPIGAPWTDPVVMEFLEHLESSYSFNNSVDAQQFTAGLHSLEV